MRWAIRYVSGEWFTNADGDPHEAPGGGVLAVTQEDTIVGLAIHQGSDFYLWGKQYGGWAGMDYFGLAQELMRPGLKVIKLGEQVSISEYRDIIAEVRRNPHLPDKSARYAWEVKV